MSKFAEVGSNLSNILSGLIAVIGIVAGWLWRVSLSLSKHDSRLETLEACAKKSETEQAEVLKAARDNAERLARIETDVKWLRDTIGGERHR